MMCVARSILDDFPDRKLKASPFGLMLEIPCCTVHLDCMNWTLRQGRFLNSWHFELLFQRLSTEALKLLGFVTLALLI